MNTKKALESWRKQIDTIDEEIINNLKIRIDIVKKIAKYKKSRNIKPFDKKRWQELLQASVLKACSLSIPGDLIKKIYNLIHKHSLKIERDA